MNNDLISRSELRKAFKKCPVFTEVYLHYARQLIDNAPTERPKGEWIVVSNGTTNHYACSKCRHAGDFQDKFCRWCGADMRKEVQNETN